MSRIYLVMETTWTTVPLCLQWYPDCPNLDSQSLPHTVSLKQELIFLAPRLGLSLWKYLAVTLIPDFNLVLTILWNCPGFSFLPYGYYRKSSVPLTIKDFFFSKHVKVPWKQTFIHLNIKNYSPGTTIPTTVPTNDIVTLFLNDSAISTSNFRLALKNKQSEKQQVSVISECSSVETFVLTLSTL